MRNRLQRRIGYSFRDLYYKPRGVPLRQLDEVAITKEELETLRLRFIEKLEQVDAAKRMGISRSQYQRDITAAMKKITKCIIEGKALRIVDYLDLQRKL